jgi:protein-S-isoprenylcysteine O-methyltransferase Ste14
MTAPSGYSPASPVDAARAWKRRARFRWWIAALLGVLTLILFFLWAREVVDLPLRHGCCGPPTKPEADPWVAVSALGTLAAGIGAVISSIAAILALRAAAATLKTTSTPVKEQSAAVAAKKPSAKRKTRRRRAA